MLSKMSQQSLKMASREEWCADKLSKLQQEDLRISALTEIKNHLSSIPQSEASRYANGLDLPLVFDCLNDSNIEQVDLACEVLTLCLTNLSLVQSTSAFDVSLERALNHPHSPVKIMALEQIRRNISKEECLCDISKKQSLLTNVIKCMGDDDISVAKNAIDILVQVGYSDMGLKTLVSEDISKELQEVMAISEVVRLRVYEVVVLVAKECELNLDRIKATGILTQLLDELDTSDILLKMNVVELLTELGLSRHGYTFLEQHGILSKLFSTVEDTEDQLTLQYCEPGILKFFGNIAHWKPIELMSKYPKIFDRLFLNLESGDLTIVGISLDTLGIIGLSNQGKCALQSTGNKITYAIKTIVKCLSSFPTDVKIRALSCIENLLRITDQATNVTQITKQWFTTLGDDPMDLIIRYAKNPFSELKLAGLSILQAMAEQQWGQEEIRNYPGLVEYLLDRNMESFKEAKEKKYNIVKALTVSTVFEDNILNKFHAFIKEGPFHVETVTEVALERNE